MGDVTTGDSELAKRNTHIYSLQLREYANQMLSPAELNVYVVLFDNIRQSHNLSKPEDLMMLDIAVFDFMRIKRLHKNIQEHGDMSEMQTRGGQTYQKASEANYLLNAVESQFRQNMKELLLTQKEQTKKALMLGEKDLASWLNSRVVDVPADEVEQKVVEEQTDEIPKTDTDVEGKDSIQT
jgi:hypothetical protein